MKKILIIITLILLTNSINRIYSQTIKIHCSFSVYAYGNGFFSEDDKYYFYSTQNIRGYPTRKYIVVRNLEDCNEIKAITFHALEQDEVWDFKLQYLNSVNQMMFVVKNKLYFYDFNSNSVIDSIYETGDIQQLTVSTYQEKIAYYINENDSLKFKFFNLVSKIYDEQFTLQKFYFYNKVFFNPDMEQIYFTGNEQNALNNYLTVWSVKNQKVDTTILVAPRKINNIAVLKDNKFILISADNGYVYMIDKFNYKIENDYNFGNMVSQLKFMNNPDYCFVSSYDQKSKISIYSLIEKKELFTFSNFHAYSDFRISKLNNYLIEIYNDGYNGVMSIYKLNIDGVSSVENQNDENIESGCSNEFQIFDIYGKIIKSGLGFTQNELDNLNSGLYFIHEKTSNNGMSVRKFIVTK